MRLVSACYDDFFPFDTLPNVTDKHVSIDAKELSQEDILIVWGGADISPSLYNKAVSRYCGASDRPSYRDKIEWAMMNKAAELDVPIIGICRGAQMLCALAGGFLLQDVNNHGSHHDVQSYDGQTLRTNSCHHQMMMPFQTKHEMLASIKTPISTLRYDVDNMVDVPEEPEAIYFPGINGIAVQWHPEWMDGNCDATTFVKNEFVKRAYG